MKSDMSMHGNESMKHHSSEPHYRNEESRPGQAKLMAAPHTIYKAEGLQLYNQEMMNISYGKYGESGHKHDESRITPYMMYNDSTDQNGY